MSQIYSEMSNITKFELDKIKLYFDKFNCIENKKQTNFKNIFKITIKIILLLIFSLLSLFKIKKEKILKVDVLFEKYSGRIYHIDDMVYRPIIDLFNNLNYGYFSRDIVKDKKGHNYQYIQKDMIGDVLTLIKIKFKFNNSISWNQFLEFINHYIYYQYILNIIDCKVFISFYDVGFNPILYCSFKKQNITMVSFQHGIYSPNIKRQEANQKTLNLCFEHFFLFNQSQINVCKDERNMHIDYPHPLGGAMLNYNILKYKNIQETHLICFSETVSYWHHANMQNIIFVLDITIQYCRKNNIKLLYAYKIKKERRKDSQFAKIADSIEYIDSLLERNSDIVDTSDNIYKSIAKSKVVISYSGSTISSESIGFGKYAYIFNFFGEVKSYPDKNTFYCITQKDEKLIEQNLNYLLNDDNKVYLDNEFVNLKRYYINSNPKKYYDTLKQIIVDRLRG